MLSFEILENDGDNGRDGKVHLRWKSVKVGGLLLFDTKDFYFSCTPYLLQNELRQRMDQLADLSA